MHANLVEKIELFLSAEIAQVETLEQARALEGLSTLDQLFHLLLQQEQPLLDNQRAGLILQSTLNHQT